MYLRQVKDFILHLRLNYQFFILSGPYLLGVLLSNHFSNLQIIQFLSVHALLFGGVTAYNSYFDKDEGPIGGLKNPPKMSHWMLILSWSFQVVGLCIGFQSGYPFVFWYIMSIIFFWMYSSPRVRLKGKPIASLIAIGLGTVVCALFLGFYSNGNTVALPLEVIIAAIGAMCLVISMYPLSQVYQVEEDKRRGDITFSVRYGKRGVRKIFIILFPIGVLIASSVLYTLRPMYGSLFVIGGLITGYSSYHVIRNVFMTRDDYKKVMRVKYFGGLIFSLCMLLFILLK